MVDRTTRAGQDDGYKKMVESYEEAIQISFYGERGDVSKAYQGSSDNEGHSQQIFTDPFEEMAAGEYLKPPTDPKTWAAAMEMNTRLFKCIHIYARNTVGLGWEIQPIQPGGHKKEVPGSFDAEKERALNLFIRPNPKMPFNKVMELIKIDEEATGNGYMEVVRNNSGDIEQLWHIPSVTVRVRNPRRITWMKADGHPGFVQIRGNKKRYFKEFGDENVVNAKTGDQAAGGLPIDDRATEIIQFMIYAPRSTWYGMPRYVPASPAITGNRLAAIRNVTFFENDAVPRMIIAVSGGTLSASSTKSIENFVRRGAKGVQKAHRVMVLQTDKRRIGTMDAKAQINVIPLTVGMSEDASFMGYRRANDEEVREAFGIGRAFFTMDDVNRASATESRRITNEQEFEPDRIEKDYIINEDIMRSEPINATASEFRFRRPKRADPSEQAEIDRIYATLGAITPNELRKQIGLPPYPDEYVFANKPFNIALMELQLGLALAIDGTGQKLPEAAKKVIESVVGDIGKLQEQFHKHVERKDGGLARIEGVVSGKS